jgi:hypothetical protein
MDPRNSPSPAFLAALACTIAATAMPASAGINAGAYASRTNTGSGGGFLEDSDYGSTPGHYVASVTDASANLSWSATNSTFTGFADGGDGITARSQGIAIVTFGTDTSISVTYGMDQLVGSGDQVGWGVIDAGTGESVFGLSFDNGRAIAIGGVGTDANGSFTGSVSAGTYWLVMIAESTGAGGYFAYDATFAAVPAPGTIVLLAAFVAARTRRRTR